MVQYTHAIIFIFIPLLCPTMELMKNVHHIKAVTTGCRSTFITRYSILASLGILWRLLDSIVQVVVLWLMGEGCGGKQRGEFQIFHISRLCLCRNGVHLKCLIDGDVMSCELSKSQPSPEAVPDNASVSPHICLIIMSNKPKLNNVDNPTRVHVTGVKSSRR
jgi:hypothetical protein